MLASVPFQYDDIGRPVYSILGVPVDDVTMDQAAERIDSAGLTKSPFFLVTPNVNFLVNAHTDPAFLKSIIEGDLSIPDGKWLVWLGRLLGAPLKERVAGADILDRIKLGRTSAHPFKVFLFGGANDVGARAAELMNSRKDGLTCVGSANPGFGSVEEISTDALLQKVNETDADFLLVALGAKKGQEWLIANREKLRVPVRAHLGGTINFLAGTVARAPIILQMMGLEWIWRIKEEPGLWRRYVTDAIYMGKLLFSHIIPLLYFRLAFQLDDLFGQAKLEVVSSQGGNLDSIRLSGALVARYVDEALTEISKALAGGRNLQIDLAGAKSIDARFIGLLLMAKKAFSRQQRRLAVVNAPIVIRKILTLNGFVLSADEYQKSPELAKAGLRLAAIATPTDERSTPAA